MKKIKKQIIFSIALLSLFLCGYFFANTAASSMTYTPMEEIPGFGRPSDFPTYLMSIYKFGLWAIGIAALLMITIGGYMYIGSAGNKAAAGTAKKIIGDAIAGIILAMVSWLLLYLINPDLVKFNVLSTNPSATSSTLPTTSKTTASSSTSDNQSSWYFTWSNATTLGLSNGEEGPFKTKDECEISRQKKTSFFFRTYDCKQK